MGVQEEWNSTCFPWLVPAHVAPPQKTSAAPSSSCSLIFWIFWVGPVLSCWLSLRLVWWPPIGSSPVSLLWLCFLCGFLPWFRNFQSKYSTTVEPAFLSREAVWACLCSQRWGCCLNHCLTGLAPVFAYNACYCSANSNHPWVYPSLLLLLQ